MKLLFMSLLVLIGAVAFALLLRDDSGHVLLSYGDWTVETSLLLLIAAVLLLFLALYYTIRLWAGLRGLPQGVRRWRRRRRNAKVQISYKRGMIALAEGHWPEAEKWLLKYVHHSETPALHYLAAAEAAEAQGSHVRRDSYLRAAFEHDRKAEVAVGLAQAGYQLRYRKTAEAAALLTRLHLTLPKHPAVLKKLMEAAIAEESWGRVLELVPELQRHNVLPVAKVEELQATAYRALLVDAGQRQDADAVRALWERVPRAIKRNEDVLFDYARALTAADALSGAELEPLLAEAITRRWSGPLVYAYGLVGGSNLSGQLATAERWLKHHPRDAVLLLTLGRLCVRNQLWGKGRSYLEASLGIEPQPETYRELGALLEKLNNNSGALECYRNALGLTPAKDLPSFTAPAPRYRPVAPGELPLLPAQ